MDRIFYHTTDIEGVSMLNPDRAAMLELLARLDQPEAAVAEHPDVSLVHDPSAWSISAFPSGTVVFENLDSGNDNPLYMNNVSRSETLEMWEELSKGKIESLHRRPWLTAVD